ncbi:replication factor C large subunit [Candidatus Woesearchaeota archaeon]|nr:replication factor C large subunit [Candidatus Woesearchaeota archaeon]
MKPWTKLYEPNYLNEIVGQEKALFTIEKALTIKKPLLFHGPTGTGKTITAHLLGKEKNLEVFEINASDVRNKENIQNILGSAMTQHSLFSKGKIILIDDIDALSGTKDRGGLPAIESLLESTKFPVIITCINPWDDKFSKLRRKCTLIEFNPIKTEAMREVLKNIAEKEGIESTEEILTEIGKWSKGDMRAAITDLQTYGITKILNTEEKGERDKEEDLLFCLRKILKGKKWEEVYNIFDKSNEDINECLLWLDENLPKEYKGADLNKAYTAISKADVYNGRIRRWQHWRFLIYINALLTAGVAFAKKETNPSMIEYTRTTRLLKLWQANMKYAKKKSIAEKIAEATHTSKKRAIKDSFPYLKNVILQKAIQQELELEEEEIEWLRK